MLGFLLTSLNRLAGHLWRWTFRHPILHKRAEKRKRKWIQNLEKGMLQDSTRGLHDIEPAFTSGGITYYQFRDDLKVPAVRMFRAQQYYREMMMGVDREFLDTFAKTMRELLNMGKLGDAFSLVQKLGERNEAVFEPDMVYKLASCLYFDASEDPYDYDPDYALEKVARWKKEPVERFFLSLPHNELIPSTEQFGTDTQSYVEGMGLKKSELYRIMLGISETNPGKKSTTG